MTKSRRLLTLARIQRHLCKLAVVAAIAPLFQIPGCTFAPIQALNFQLQNLVNVTLIDWVSVLVSNFLHL